MSEHPLQWGDERFIDNYAMELLDPKYLRPPQPGKDFCHSRLVDKLMRLSSKVFYVIGEQFKGVDISDEALSVNGFAIPKLAVGREESRRKVAFGQMLLTSKNQGARAEMVAVKPMGARDVAREYHAATRVASLLSYYDRPITYTTLGFYRDEGEGRVNLVTRYEHRVHSADQVLWDRSAMPSGEMVKDVLGKASETLSALHGVGVSHGDAQPKNIASDFRGIRIIDSKTPVTL